jgi:hypothetical protein
MAFCTPFAQLAASPLAAAFPGAAPASAAATQNGSSNSSAYDESFMASDDLAFAPAHQYRAQLSMPLRAGSYCLAGSLSECRAAKALGRVSCGPSCGGEYCSTDPCSPQHGQRQLLPQQLSLPPFRDFDALLAAAACKPGYGDSTDLTSTPAPAAFAGEPCAPVPEVAAPAPAVCTVLEQYAATHVADGGAAGIADAALGLIAEHTLADTFYIYDLGEVRRASVCWCAVHTWRSSACCLALWVCLFRCNGTTGGLPAASCCEQPEHVRMHVNLIHLD